MRIRIKRNCTFPRVFGLIQYKPGAILHNARRVDSKCLLGSVFEVEDMLFDDEDAEEIPEPPVETAQKRAVAAAKVYDVFANAAVALAKVSDTGYLCVFKNEEWVPVCALKYWQYDAWKDVTR